LEIENDKGGMNSRGMMFMLSFMNICALVQKLLGEADMDIISCESFIVS